MGQSHGSRNHVARLVQAAALGTGAGCVWLIVRRFGRLAAQNVHASSSVPAHVEEAAESLSLLVELPEDLLQGILRRLNPRECAALQLTCVKLRSLLQHGQHSLSVPQLSHLPASHLAQLPHRFPHVTQLQLNDTPSSGVLDTVLDVVLPTRRWRAAIPQLTMALASAFLLHRLVAQLKQRHGVARVLVLLWVLGPPATLGMGLLDIFMHSMWNLTLSSMEARAQMAMGEGRRPGWFARWLLGSHLSATHPLHSRTSSLFRRLPAITHLQLGEALVRPSIIGAAADLTQLRSLSLVSSPSFCSPSLSTLILLTHLTSFRLVCTSYDNFRMSHYLHHSDETIKHLTHLANLADFTMSPCMGITDAGLAMLSHLTRLTSLHLLVCLEVSDDGLLALSPLTRLQSLSLTWPLYTTPSGVSRLATSLTAITSLDFSGNQWGLTDDSLECISRHMKKLRVLNVYMCYGIAGGMALAGPMLSQLQSLTVPWSPGGYVQIWSGSPWATCLKALRCVADSDSCLAHLHRLSGLTSLRIVLHSRVAEIASASLSRLTRLTSLSVDFNERGSISTPGWYAVLRSLTGVLQQLTVQRDSQLDGMSMRALKMLLERLIRIDLELCEHVSTAGVAEWLAHLPRLQHLGLWQCPNLNKLRLIKLQQHYSFIAIKSELLGNVRFATGNNRHPGPTAVNPQW